MEQQPNVIQRDSSSWIGFVKLSFALAFSATLVGIWFMPVELWVRGYMTMGLIYVVGSSFTLAKTLRDEHEADKLINKISQAKTAKMLNEYDAA
ncbi:MAG: YiaA/YiaB family inner membrane protein [Acidobacteriota bacterium]